MVTGIRDSEWRPNVPRMHKQAEEALSLEALRAQSGERRCDHPGCREAGVYRAPKSRDQLNQYYWFCLEHVRAYNKAWNYYEGFSGEALEEEARRSTTWDRPSWPFGTGKKPHPRAYAGAGYNDPFGVFEGDDPLAGGAGGPRQDTKDPNRPSSGSPEAAAMRLMGLEPPVTMEALKRRYKELVKRHHPDANGGDKAAEERLKLINEAYTTLKRFLE